MKVQLICEKVIKHLDGFTLSNIDFTAEPGEITGIIGVNGSGKTTLIRTLLGAYRLWESDSGRIRMESVNRSGEEKEDGSHVRISELDGEDSSKRYKDKIAYVLTRTPYPINMICIEVGEIYGRYYSGFDLELYREKLSDFSLKENQRIGALSTGERMRQQIAFALASGADVCLMNRREILMWISERNLIICCGNLPMMKIKLSSMPHILWRNWSVWRTAFCGLIKRAGKRGRKGFKSSLERLMNCEILIG